MKIKNINKKLLAGLLGAVMLTTPLGLTACGSGATNNYSKATQDEVSNSTSEFRYRFEDAKEIKIITIESAGQHTILLVSKLVGYDPATYYRYHDIFSGVEFKEREVKVLKEENLGDYLFAYNYLQKSYSKQELKDFFEKIKSEIYVDEKGNIKVKR